MNDYKMTWDEIYPSQFSFVSLGCFSKWTIVLSVGLVIVSVSSIPSYLQEQKTRASYVNHTDIWLLLSHIHKTASVLSTWSNYEVYVYHID